MTEPTSRRRTRTAPAATTKAPAKAPARKRAAAPKATPAHAKTAPAKTTPAATTPAATEAPAKKKAPRKKPLVLSLDFSIALAFGRYAATVEAVKFDKKTDCLKVFWRIEDELDALLVEHFFLEQTGAIDRLHKLATLFDINVPLETFELDTSKFVGKSADLEWGLDYPYEVSRGQVSIEDEDVKVFPDEEADIIEDLGNDVELQEEELQEEVTDLADDVPEELELEEELEEIRVGSRVAFIDDRNDRLEGVVDSIDGDNIVVIDDEEKLEWDMSVEDLVA